MTEDATNLILGHLRHIRHKVDRVADDVVELKQWMTAAEAAINRLQQAVDRVGVRLDRIETRLGLIDETAWPQKHIWATGGERSPLFYCQRAH
jgi:hypothetical protein